MSKAQVLLGSGSARPLLSLAHLHGYVHGAYSEVWTTHILLTEVTVFGFPGGRLDGRGRSRRGDTCLIYEVLCHQPFACRVSIDAVNLLTCVHSRKMKRGFSLAGAQSLKSRYPVS